MDKNRYIFTNRNEEYRNTGKKFNDHIIEELASGKKEILDFFNYTGEDNFKFNVYIYDDNKSLVNGLRERGFSKDPDYMIACSKDIDHSLNFFEPTNDDDRYENSNVVFHELVHGIQGYIYGEQPEWLCEGVAKYLDGTYKKGMEYLFREWISIGVSERGELPTMHELHYEFGEHQTDHFDAYDFSYMIVNYLIEKEMNDNNIDKKSAEKIFVNNIKSKEYIKSLEDNEIVVDAYNYYNEKYKRKIS